MQKPLVFLLVFTVVYILLNLLYQGLLFLYEPLPDPFTVAVTKLTLYLLPELNCQLLPGIPGLQVLNQHHPVVNIKEGCNGIAVYNSLLSFIIAYRSNAQAYLLFIPLSFVCIQLSNILRLFVLIKIRLSQPSWFNFFHSYAFPAIIYLFAFLLMVLWVKKFTKLSPDE